MVDISGASAGIDAEEPERTGMKARARLILAFAATGALAALLVWFVRYELHGKYIESTNDAYIRADAVTVSPKISGYVEQVLVADNQDVKAGQPLVRIDPRDYRAQAAQYQAQTDVAAANVENVRATILEQQAEVDAARAQLAAAQDQARFAQREVDRYAPLAASGAETRERLTILQNQAAQAMDQLASRRAALMSAMRRIGSLQAQERQARAQTESTRAQLAAADVNLGSTVIRASVDGRVGDKSVQAGQFAQAGTRLMTVVALDSLYIAANFKETQIGRMRVGQLVTVHIDALDGVDLHGRIQSLAPGTGAIFSLLPPQNATGNFTKIVQRVPVRIAIEAGPEARRLLVPGLSATVKVDTRSGQAALDAIRDEQKLRGQSGR